MKLVEVLKKNIKEDVYDTYLEIVYAPKDYNNVSRVQMAKEIIKEYSQENFLYHMCTKRELTFLKYFCSKKNLSEKDFEKYKWEISELTFKCIFDPISGKIYEEQIENVKEALKKFKEVGKNDDVVVFMISKVKQFGEISVDVLENLLCNVSDMHHEAFNAFLGNPLFHFYCGFILDDDKELVFYRKYESYLDIIADRRKKYGLAGTMEINVLDDIDIFYYGFPIRKPSVKKMWDVINKKDISLFLFDIIEIASAINDRTILEPISEDEELIDIINDALDDIPCCCMNGLTPKQFAVEKEDEILLDEKFLRIPQNGANLNRRDADLFYKLYLSLLDFTNCKYNVEPKIKKIYKQSYIDPKLLISINDYLFNNKNIIDEYVSSNPNDFSSEELEIIEGFKSAIKSDNFIVVGFEREYTQILSEDGKMYMVKGIRENLYDIISEELPVFISTTLLMFKGKIVFNSFLSCYGVVDFGNQFKRATLKEMKNAIKYYHL